MISLYSIIILYLLACLYLATKSRSNIYSLRDYAIGSESFPVAIMVATIFATGVSAHHLIGTTENICKQGFYIGLVVLIRPIYWLLTGYILSRNIEKLSGCISITDVFKKLYSNTAGNIINVLALLISIGVVVVQFTAIASIINFISPNSYYASTLVLIILVGYSSFGGIRAVSFTDLFQFLIFYIAIPTVCIFGLKEAQGFNKLVSSLVGINFFDISFNRESGLDFISLIAITLIPEIDPPHIQRVLMQKTKEKVFYTYKIISLFSIPFYLTIVTLGLLMVNADISDAKDNGYFLYYAKQVLPDLGFSFMVVGLLAIIMSTADSYLNTASVLISQVFIKCFNKHREVFIARINCILIGFLAIPIALQDIFIWKITFFIYNFWYPIVTLPIIFGFCQGAANSRDFYFSMLGALIGIAIGGYFNQEIGTASLLIGMLGSALSFIVGMLFTKKKWLSYKFNVLNEDLFLIASVSICLFCAFSTKNLLVIILSMFAVFISVLSYFKTLFSKLKDISSYYIYNMLFILILFIGLFTFVESDSYFKLIIPILHFIIAGTVSYLLIIYVGICVVSVVVNWLSGDLLLCGNVNLALGALLLIFNLLGRTNFLNEISSIVLNKSSKKNDIPLFIKNKIKVDEFFFNMMQNKDKSESIRYIVGEELFGNKKHKINFIKLKQDIIDFTDVLRRERNINLNINSNLQYMMVNIDEAELYQIFFSLVSNVIELSKEHSSLEIYIEQKDIFFEIRISYDGYFFSKQEILNFVGNKQLINPYLLNWDKLIDLFINLHINYSFSKCNEKGLINVNNISENTAVMDVLDISDYIKN